MVAVGRSLDGEQAELAVPACPEWTVREVFAHQAGVCADILAGRMEGVATDDWTARQVAERADHSLPRILDEWDRDAPAVVELLAPVADQVDPRLLGDQWTHDQDVRGAVGRPGARNDRRAGYVTRGLIGAFVQRVGAADLDPVIVDTGLADVPAGGARLVVDPFEFARAGLGRRSRAQMSAWAWPVDDPGPYIDVLPVFTARTTDLVEPG